MAFKFIHMADVHLDTPFKNKDRDLRLELKEYQRRAFIASIDMAIDKEADALLIAGDMFDSDTLSFSTEKLILKEMGRLKNSGIDVFYAPGNHDPYGSSSRLKNILFPDNVHIFKSSEPEVYKVSSRDGQTIVNIVGIGHQNSREGGNLAAAFPKADGVTPYVGLLHGFVTSAFKESSHDRYAPCTLKELIDKNYLYWALGHIHQRSELSYSPCIIYPGNIIGRNHGEEGLKGVYMVSIDSYGNVEPSFEVLTDICWKTVTINDISDASNLEEIENIINLKVSECLCEIKDKSGVFLKLILEGPNKLYNELNNEEDIDYLKSSLKEMLDVKDIELQTDLVTKPINIGAYRDQPHILGKVLSLLQSLDEDDSELLSLCPEELGGFDGNGDEEKAAYLKELLDGLDYEAASRLIREDKK